MIINAFASYLIGNVDIEGFFSLLPSNVRRSPIARRSTTDVMLRR